MPRTAPAWTIIALAAAAAAMDRSLAEDGLDDAAAVLESPVRDPHSEKRANLTAALAALDERRAVLIALAKLDEERAALSAELQQLDATHAHSHDRYTPLAAASTQRAPEAGYGHALSDGEQVAGGERVWHQQVEWTKYAGKSCYAPKYAAGGSPLKDLAVYRFPRAYNASTAAEFCTAKCRAADAALRCSTIVIERHTRDARTDACFLKGGHISKSMCHTSPESDTYTVPLEPAPWPAALKAAVHATSRPPTSCAIFTLAHNDEAMLRVWLRYYLRHASHADELYVLDHNSTDGSVEMARAAGVNVHSSDSRTEHGGGAGHSG